MCAFYGRSAFLIVPSCLARPVGVNRLELYNMLAPELDVPLFVGMPNMRMASVQSMQTLACSV